MECPHAAGASTSAAAGKPAAWRDMTGTERHAPVWGPGALGDAPRQVYSRARDPEGRLGGHARVAVTTRTAATAGGRPQGRAGAARQVGVDDVARARAARSLAAGLPTAGCSRSAGCPRRRGRSRGCGGAQPTGAKAAVGGGRAGAVGTP